MATKPTKKWRLKPGYTHYVACEVSEEHPRGRRKANAGEILELTDEQSKLLRSRIQPFVEGVPADLGPDEDPTLSEPDTDGINDSDKHLKKEKKDKGKKGKK